MTAGGTPHPAVVTDDMRRIVETLQGVLKPVRHFEENPEIANERIDPPMSELIRQ